MSFHDFNELLAYAKHEHIFFLWIFFFFVYYKFHIWVCDDSTWYHSHIIEHLKRAEYAVISYMPSSLTMIYYVSCLAIHSYIVWSMWPYSNTIILNINALQRLKQRCIHTKRIPETMEFLSTDEPNRGIRRRRRKKHNIIKTTTMNQLLNPNETTSNVNSITSINNIIFNVHTILHYNKMVNNDDRRPLSSFIHIQPQMQANVWYKSV